MENHISPDFLNKIDKILKSASDDILTGKATNRTALFKLLMALPLNTEIVDVNDVTMECKSFREFIIKNAIKNNQLNKIQGGGFTQEVQNLSAFYFTNNMDADGVAMKNGIVCKGLDFDCDSFYGDCTTADMQIKDDWDIIKECIPPTNAMFIVDQYIFGKPFDKKLSSLIAFLKLYKMNLDIPFHLSILFSLDHSIPSQINQAVDSISALNDIEFRLYAGGKIPRPDRLIFTNYTSGNIGHPFDNRDTRFSQNFLGNENSEEKIIRNYRDYKIDLLYWNSYLNKVPAKMIDIQTIWESSNFKNRLFIPFV